MDCEKFDQVVIDALYGELDELTLAAVRRHTEGCPRCQSAWSGLRATRKIGVLALVPAPAGLPDRVLALAREAQRNVSWPTRFGRLMSRAAGYAMRPQTAMAAIFLLAIGGAVLVMRPRPEHSAAQNRVSVTERGVPEPSADDPRPFGAAAPTPAPPRRDEPAAATAPLAFAEAAERAAAGPKARAAEAPGEAAQPRAARDLGVAEGIAPAAPSPIVEGEDLAAGAGASAGEYARGKELYNARRYPEAERAFSAAVAAGGKDSAWAELYAAKSAEAAYGCRNAAPKYEAVDAHNPGTSAGAEALWGAANCYKMLGDSARARQLYGALRSVAAYRERAEAEMGTVPAAPAAAQLPAAARAAAKAKPATAGAPAAHSPAAPPPASSR